MPSATYVIPTAGRRANVGEAVRSAASGRTWFQNNGRERSTIGAAVVLSDIGECSGVPIAADRASRALLAGGTWDLSVALGQPQSGGTQQEFVCCCCW